MKDGVFSRAGRCSFVKIAGFHCGLGVDVKTVEGSIKGGLFYADWMIGGKRWRGSSHRLTPISDDDFEVDDWLKAAVVFATFAAIASRSCSSALLLRKSSSLSKGDVPNRYSHQDSGSQSSYSFTEPRIRERGAKTQWKNGGWRMKVQNCASLQWNIADTSIKNPLCCRLG